MFEFLASLISVGVLVAVVATVLVYVAFLALCGAKLIIGRGALLPADMRAVAKLVLAVGYPADVAYNWTRGAWMFRRGWRLEWLGTTFSSHIQARVDRGDRDSMTMQWVKLLNAGDPGHIGL